MTISSNDECGGRLSAPVLPTGSKDEKTSLIPGRQKSKQKTKPLSDRDLRTLDIDPLSRFAARLGRARASLDRGRPRSVARGLWFPSHPLIRAKSQVFRE